MPIEKFTYKEPRKYDLPYIGQVFCHEEQDGREEWGIVNGVKPVHTDRLVDGKKEKVLAGWTASMTTGFRDFRGLLTHTATYQSSTDWHPAPFHEQIGPAIRDMLKVQQASDKAWDKAFCALHDRLAAAESDLRHAIARIDVLEAKTQDVTASTAPAPSNPAPAPTPVQGTNPERPRRGASA